MLVYNVLLAAISTLTVEGFWLIVHLSPDWNLLSISALTAALICTPLIIGLWLALGYLIGHRLIYEQITLFTAVVADS